jgi:hypothetical protein
MCAHQESINQAIRQNNQAVSMLGNRNYYEAIITLSHCLQACREILCERDDNNTNRCSGDHSTTELNLDQCMEQTNRSKLFRHFKKSGRNEYYLHVQALRIPLNNRHLQNYSTLLVVCSVVAFNFALAHQLTAREGNEEDIRSTKLQKAATLYEICLSMQQVEEQLGPNTLFIMASVNNLGLIYSELNDQPKASMCINQVLSTLMYLVESGSDYVFELDGFFRNVYSVISKTCSAPAA